MSKRFFKLLYIIALIGVVVSLPVYLLSSIEFDKIAISSYKALCNSNNKYVTLEGMEINEAYIFDEIALNDDGTYSDTEKTLNFYCKYYNEAQPYIIAYAESRTSQEQVLVNKNFFRFQESVMSSVSSYPALYRLELVDTKIEWYRLYGPIVDGIVVTTLAFLILQILKICYIYVVYGELVWHPFKKSNKE